MKSMEGEAGGGPRKMNSGSLATRPDTRRARGAGADALTAGSGHRDQADASFGNISPESLEPEWIQEDLQHLQVFIFLMSPSNVFL